MGYCPFESRHNGLYRDTEAGKVGLAVGSWVTIQNCILAERGQLWVARQCNKAATQCCDTEAARCHTTCDTARCARSRSWFAIQFLCIVIRRGLRHDLVLRHGAPARACAQRHGHDTTGHGLRHDALYATIRPSARHDMAPCARPGRSGRAMGA